MKLSYVIFVSLFFALQAFANTHVCEFKKDEQRSQPGTPIPLLTRFHSDLLSVSPSVFHSGLISLRDSNGVEVEKMSFESGTKQYNPSEGPLRYAHFHFRVNGELRDLSLSVTPNTPLARSMTSFDYEENKTIVLVNAQMQCKLIP